MLVVDVSNNRLRGRVVDDETSKPIAGARVSLMNSTVVTDRKREKTLSGLLSGKKETGLPPNRVLDQFSGMKAETGQTPWTVKKDDGTLDVVTGATITSRAVAAAVFTIAETFAAQRETLISESAGVRESL